MVSCVSSTYSSQVAPLPDLSLPLSESHSRFLLPHHLFTRPQMSSNRSAQRPPHCLNKGFSLKSTQFHCKGLMFMEAKLLWGPRKPFYLCMESLSMYFKMEFFPQSVEFLLGEFSDSSKRIIILVCTIRESKHFPQIMYGVKGWYVCQY